MICLMKLHPTRVRAHTYKKRKERRVNKTLLYTYITENKIKK